MENKETKSVITHTTVYSDRAQVTRVAQIQVSEGEQVISFVAIPQYADSRSFQVKGIGKALLKDIKYREIYLKEVSDDLKRELESKLEQYQEVMKELTDVLHVQMSEKKHTESVLEKIFSENTTIKNLPEPESWAKLIDFYRTGMTDLDKNIRESNIKIKKQQKLIDEQNFQIAQTGGKAGEKQFIVDVTVLANETCELSLYLQYLIYNASWKPVYNLRVSSEEQKLMLEYAAEITQNTGENWEKIQLTLSTAQVQVNGNIPVLSPLYLKKIVYDNFEADEMDTETKNSLPVLAKSTAPKDMMKSAFEKRKDKMEAPIVEITEKTTSSVFKITGEWNIASDNKAHRTAITLIDLTAEFEYSAVPMLSPYAFLTARMANTSSFPLLPGRANVFFDGSFIAETYLKLILPEQKFEASLGVDESVKIERKQLPEMNKNEGIFTKKNKRSFAIENIITNNKKRDIKITVSEQVPVSQDADILVELIEPKIKENNSDTILANDGILKQTRLLKAGEKINLPLKYSVEHGKDIEIAGL